MDCLDRLKVLLVNHKQDVVAPQLNSHVSEFHDLTIVLKGELQYTVNGASVTVKANEAMYCAPGYTMARQKSQYATYISVNFTTKTDEELPLPSHIHNAVKPELSPFIDILCGALKNYSHHGEEVIYHLVKLILLKLIEGEEYGNPVPYVNDVKDYIESNYTQDLTLESVSKHINLHPSYCCTLFKKCEGRSITEYITHIRIEHAKELLEITDQSIGNICTQCGIPDQYYFSRVFSKATGASPTEYRRLVKSYGGSAHEYRSKEIERKMYDF